MLANLTLSGCYKNGAMSPEMRHDIMLKSAKENLRRMAFFGLTEYQQESQYLFERTFGVKFRRDFFQYNHTHASEAGISHRQQRQILKLNELDVDLYQFAKDLFSQRLQKTLREDTKIRINDIVHGRHYDETARRGTMSDDDQSKDLDKRLNLLINSARRHEEYEEGDEDDADDDDEYNHRIANQKKYTP